MKRIILLLLVCSFFSCQNVQRPEKPTDLIPKEKMVDILTESYLATAARGVGNKNVLGQNVKLDSLIYAKYQIDSLQFLKSNDYYAADINSYIEIFEEVQNRLSEMERDYDSAREVEQQLQDSIVDQEIEAKRFLERTAQKAGSTGS